MKPGGLFPRKDGKVLSEERAGGIYLSFQPGIPEGIAGEHQNRDLREVPMPESHGGVIRGWENKAVTHLEG